MDITEIRVTLRNEDKLKAFVNVTFDNAFVVRGLKVINGNTGYFVSMPSRKRPDGTHQDVAHPINNKARQLIEGKVLAAYQEKLKQESAVEVLAAGETSESQPPAD
ncbi:MAG: SpoVG family protein [candidate division Zixibacteria bacterium]|nr:SpoVG family protein [candidate division Zixibacteria bacterium]